MRMIDIIVKKRNGFKLLEEEINFFIQEYTLGNIPDYQVSALLMAIYFQKLDSDETTNLTRAMMNSGETIDLTLINGIKVDKHSTGGVGDKTTIALAPIVAACGVPVAKMSGRGLGHTGGTVDKLESIPKLNTTLSKENFIKQVNEIGISVIGQSNNLVPADKKLYSLRDVTSTVDNISLIASSIMSKKLASGADAIVLDVKTGSGAFMQNLDDSISLAKEMVKIGLNMKRETVAMISDMDQPLGWAIGNCLEVKEAIDILKDQGPDDLKKLCIELGAYMLLLGKRVDNIEQGKEEIKNVISSGLALETFKKFILSQGGEISCIDNTDLLPQASDIHPVLSKESGYIENIQANVVGTAAMLLGAGRMTKDSNIDLAVGIVLNKKCGDYVEAGEPLAYIHSNDINKKILAIEKLVSAYKITQRRPETRPLIFDIITKDTL
ncbi:pyrimidine-nucleoside phosphorylase [Serpentinicella sp. ANB-PHB4]|uniref:pyrimidine-nucleoside phosphorylase n=1 Tax=Serpentinicella sp. ANB-PHB4 TaxID=3074076 RepID=UPI002865F712|nr:pyrimidine-nucleoside phosphorylase [Serpentinicella sp. ANB-PHB4]MDR5658168.1 pyrimidine-nucleoside phosphorylase [Serpentinicella sp. ANB-PHB4]